MGSFLMQLSVPVPIATSGSMLWCCWYKQLVGAWPGRWKEMGTQQKQHVFGKRVGEGNKKNMCPCFFESEHRKKESGKYQDYIVITCKPWEDAMTNKSSNHPFEVLSIAQSRLMVSTSLQRAEILQLTNSNIKSVRAKSRGKQFHSKSFLKSWTKKTQKEHGQRCCDHQCMRAGPVYIAPFSAEPVSARKRAESQGFLLRKILFFDNILLSFSFLLYWQHRKIESNPNWLWGLIWKIFFGKMIWLEIWYGQWLLLLLFGFTSRKACVPVVLTPFMVMFCQWNHHSLADLSSTGNQFSLEIPFDETESLARSRTSNVEIHWSWDEGWPEGFALTFKLWIYL